MVTIHCSTKTKSHVIMFQHLKPNLQLSESVKFARKFMHLFLQNVVTFQYIINTYLYQNYCAQLSF